MKIKNTNNMIMRLMLFVVASIILFFLLPREERSKYTYVVNRPWSHPLLTAPFDIPIKLDSLSAKDTRDSVNRKFQPIYTRSLDAEKKRIETLQAALQSSDIHLSANQRQSLSNALRTLFDHGVVDYETYTGLNNGSIPGIRILTNNVAEAVNTNQVVSSRMAYTYMDSVARAAKISGPNVSSYITKAVEPNLQRDTLNSERFLEEAYQKELAPKGIIQQGERIIDKGDIVTPQLYTVLTTYEELVAARATDRDKERYYVIIGEVLTIMLMIGALYAYLYFYRRRFFADLRRLFFLVFMLVTQTAFMLFISSNMPSAIYIVPFAIVLICTLVFYDGRTAFFTYMLTVLMAAVMARLTVEFVIVQFIAGLTGMVSIKELTRRSQLLLSALLIFISSSVTYVAMELLHSGTITMFSLNTIGCFGINAVMISFAYVLIFIFEKIFGFTSTVTLVELSDINNPILRELSEQCPGTFQHSMAVSNLATIAARRIGADVQLVRTGALYHDIGKIDNPVFFTENQHGVNPHDGLDPRQSAQIVINHVEAGLKKAEKAKLPVKLRDFITEHHGAGTARYFYTTYLNQHPDEEVDPTPFQYPGPNPRTRETSILMMADAVEAASRSLNNHTVESITDLVNRIVDAQIAEGLHSESELSFTDVKKIKESFISRLRTIYHARISYPDAKRPATVNKD